MAARKKAAAELRTINLFTKKSVLEEAQDLAAEEGATADRPSGPRDMSSDAEECAIKWLGLDAFHEGDDIKLAVHPAGHAVMVLVYTEPKGSAVSTRTFKLTRTQWQKLRRLVREA